MYVCQVKIETLIILLKQLDNYVRVHHIKESHHISFDCFKMIGNDLLWWEIYVDSLRTRKKTHDYEMGGFQGIA